MDKARMRGYDLLVSLALVVFSIWALVVTLRMPMTESYGAVKNVWYVSPALLPLIVNSGILLLSTMMLFFALKQNGWSILKSIFMEMAGKKFTVLPEKSQKFLVILLYICGLAYVFVPNIDFYLSISLFLLMFSASFYFEDMSLLRRLGTSYFILAAFLGVLKASGLMAVLNKAFDYTTDVLVLAFSIAMIAFIAAYVRKDAENKKKLPRVYLVAYLSPFFLILVFKYFLLMPMPKEGGIIDLMNLVYYTVK